MPTGSGPCIPSPVLPFPQRCYGPSGALTRIALGGTPGFERVVTGLPSLVLATGAAEGGPADLSFHGMVAYVQIGFGGNPGQRALLGDAGALFGWLLQVNPNGEYRPLVDIANHEVLNNPYGGLIDSNPYRVLALPGRRIIADAGANALIESAANGRTRTLAVLPPVAPGGRDPVPTSVAEGPDGALYVSQLTGFPLLRPGPTRFKRGRPSSIPFVERLRTWRALIAAHDVRRPMLPSRQTTWPTAVRSSSPTVLRGWSRI